MQGDLMNQSASKSGLRTLTVVIIALIALFLLVGGIWLAARTMQ